MESRGDSGMMPVFYMYRCLMLHASCDETMEEGFEPLPILASGVTREICANPMKNFKEPPADYIIHSVIENL